MMNIAINGFGRIGRLFFRAAMQDEEFRKKFEKDKGAIGKQSKLFNPELVANIPRKTGSYRLL